MYFRNKEQKAAVCRALLETIDYAHLWTEQGPTDDAKELLNLGIQKLHKDEWRVLRIVWDIWDVGSRATALDVIKGLDGGVTAKALARLMLAYADGGNDGIDKWLDDSRMQYLLDQAENARYRASTYEQQASEHPVDSPDRIDLSERAVAERRKAADLERQSLESAQKTVGERSKGLTKN